MALERIHKRDGREVPFDERKIAAAIHKAMVAVDEADPAFAAEVASVVRLTLEQRYGSAFARERPGIEEIQDLVERALIELGRASVAKAYILYRERRAQARAAMRVDSAPAAPARGASAPRVLEAHASAPWSKGRVVAALMREAQLPRETAERVAARVEERVLRSGLRRLSTALVRELVDNELVEMGLGLALRRQVSFGLPSADLRRALETPPAPPQGVAPIHPAHPSGFAGRVAGEVLRRFALQETFSAAHIDRHLAGDWHLFGLQAPQRWLACAMPFDLLTRSPDDLRARAFEALEGVSELVADASTQLVLEADPSLWEELAAPARRRSRPGVSADSFLDPWLTALASLARASGARIDLCASFDPVQPRSAQAERLQGLCAALERSSGPCDLRLYADAGVLAAACDAAREQPLDRALEEGRLVPSWSSPRVRFAAPGCLRQARERGALALGGAVGLNLPRLALSAGAWREDAFCEALVDLARQACGALAELSRFQARAAAARGAVPRARAAFALCPLGLDEALASLGDGERRVELGARALSLLQDLAEEESRATGLGLSVAWLAGAGGRGGDPERAGARLAELDRGHATHAQGLLFAQGRGSALEPGRPYQDGLALGTAAEGRSGSAEGRLSLALSAGAWEAFPGHASRPDPFRGRAALERFLARRNEVQPSAARGALQGSGEATPQLSF